MKKLDEKTEKLLLRFYLQREHYRQMALKCNNETDSAECYGIADGFDKAIGEVKSVYGIDTYDPPEVPTIKEIVDSLDMDKIKDLKWNNRFHNLGGIEGLKVEEYESVEDSEWLKNLEKSITSAEFIRAKRDKYCISQEMLGEKIGKSKQFISDLENEIIPISNDIARKLEDVFRLDDDSWMDNQPKRKSFWDCDHENTENEGNKGED